MIDFDEPLSPQGEHRRQQILKLTLRTARQRRRHPQIVASSMALVVAIVSVAILFHRTGVPTINLPSQPNNIAVAPTQTEPSQVTIGQIETDTTISTRLALLPIARHWQQIDDDELLNSLANAGQPAGIVQVDGQAILLTSPTAEP